MSFKTILFFFIFSFTIFSHAQEMVLIPYRVGNKWGLSDVKGKIKVKAQYDRVEPIGAGYFKYTFHQIVSDTIRHYGGHTEIKEKTLKTTGILKGSKVLIAPTSHRHFTYAPDGILIGSEESYISKNSNFYTLNGEKLLPENVEKFRFIGNDHGPSPFLSIFMEHYDDTYSLMVFDTQLQKWDTTLFNRVRDLNFDRNASTESTLVCTYTDAQYEYHEMRIYFDPISTRPTLEPHTYQNKISYRDEITTYDGNSYGTGNHFDNVEVPIMVEQSEEEYQEVVPTTQTKKELPKPIPYFVKINDSITQYDMKVIPLAADEKLFFPDYYTTTMRESLLFKKGNRSGLQFTDSLRSEALYDSLRYVKNQYGIFTSSHNFLYLAGKKLANGNWQMGVLDAKGNIIIPIQYESVSPNLPVSSYDRDDQTQKGIFKFQQPYIYHDDPVQLFTLYSEGLWLAKQNGFYGIINSTNEVIMPFAYDRIWKNNISFLLTVRVEEDFYVYQKGNLYGTFLWDATGKKIKDTGAVFPKIPVFMYRDYMGIEGLDLYNLGDETDLFFCLANSDGTIYYKSK